MPSACILAIDQGTTGTTVLAVDTEGQIRGRGYRQIRQVYPKPGWVEHDPEDIWSSCLFASRDALAEAECDRPLAIGITNQRETTVAWDGQTGLPLHNAIVWQCRRTADICTRMRADGLSDWFAERTGLVLDPYFSGTKIRWLLDNAPSVRAAADVGHVRFGTVDSWLVWNLTRGQSHLTDVTNASRTLLMGLESLRWEESALELLGVPSWSLPGIRESSGVLAESAECALGGRTVIPAGVPVSGIAGDQQSALFGQACFDPGMLKATYGTGAFLLLNVGRHPLRARGGLLSTVAWSIDGVATYALEGSVFIAGAVIQWLRDELGLLRTAAESEEVARSVADTAGVYLVPAFVGMGAPYWDADARGAILGLTRGANRAHIVRAALEAIAYQVKDVVDAMAGQTGVAASEIRIDGGASANNLLAQFQADLLGVPVVRPSHVETTALGAAYLAGLGAGIWSPADLRSLWQVDRAFEPTIDEGQRSALYAGWRQAVAKVLTTSG